MLNDLPDILLDNLPAEARAMRAKASRDDCEGRAPCKNFMIWLLVFNNHT